ncbi:MAG: hypothetical protein UH687_08805 [Bacteroidaceae bacterium]|nr:hypothetical protein [Bacteroidaceae bacterium]
MKRTTLIGRMLIMLAAILCLSSCNLVWNVEDDMDVHQSIKFAGQWTGDFGMYYTYRQNGRLYTFDSYDTDIIFYPEYDGATYGYGKQVDYYERGPYEYIYNRFDWEIRNGIIYLEYYSDASLDCAIYDYVMTADNFRGRFGSSNDKFCLSKIADYYDWTAYMDYYNYYPNGGWYWSPMYTQQAASPTENTSSTENDNELNEKDGIVSYGKRI